MQLTPEVLKQYVERGLITERKHPTDDLYIYNYTVNTQYAFAWDAVTLQCRGLILDGSGAVVARPFTKFFNLGEYRNERLADLILEGHVAPISFNLSYVAADKMDGSLGILYFANGEPALATRGSFTSDQAQKGTQILRSTLAAAPQYHFEDGFTYLFEIIYPNNRIVVNYGDQEKIVLLAKRNTATGEYVEPENTPFESAETFQGKSLAELLSEQRPNREGYVLAFADGSLVKVKHDEYVRLHRILTNTSSVAIWEVVGVEELHAAFPTLPAKRIAELLQLNPPETEKILAQQGTAFTHLLDNVPDEFYTWIHEIVDEFHSSADALLAQAHALLDASGGDRKVIGQSAPTNRQAAGVAFALLDGREELAWALAWRYARPRYSTPFARDLDA